MGEQTATLKAEARRFLERESGDSRALIDDPLGHRPELLRRIGELGWLGIAVPADRGGLGLGAAELCAVAEEAGRVLLPGPFLLTAALAAPLLAETGDELSAPVIAGERVVALAWAWDAAEAGRVAGGRVRGTAPVVFDAVSAEHVLAVTRDTIAVVRAADVRVAPHEWLDLGRRAAQVRFEDTPAVTTVPIEPARIERALDVARVAVAAESLGAAERMLEISVEYASQRKQFGKPIGSFQAVQHLLARMLERVELTRAAVDGAARALDRDAADAHATALTAGIASAQCAGVAADAIQVHGGIGYTWEHDAHRFYRRTVANAAMFGDPASVRAELADLVL